MTLVHPRNDDTPAWAYSKNAHPGIRWEIPIVVQGGAWPFQYSILADGGASGLAIGGELERIEVDGFIVHRVSEAYGVLFWDDPIEGQYEIVVRVTDQEGAQLDVPISLTVGTEGWVFVDAEQGDDSNDGTVDAPFATAERLYDPAGGPSPFSTSRVYLAGVVPMDGNRENGNLRVAASPQSDPDLAPRVWVGLPDREAVLEAYEGKLIIAAPDFYVANLEHRHHQDYAPDDGSYLHMMTVWGNTARFTLHDVTFSRFQGEPNNVSLGNSSIIMFVKDAPRYHVAVVNCTQTGPSGFLTSAYELRESVFEKNRAAGASFALSDGSVWSVIYIKGGSNEHITLRANELWDSNDWLSAPGALGVLQAKNIELAYNTIATSHDGGRAGALKLWTNSPQADYAWTADTPVWIYRNSLRRRISWEGDALANMPDGTVHIENNVLDPGSIPVSPRIVSAGNLDGEAYLDDQMKLVGAARSTHLGKAGAEIAAPL